MVTRAGPVASGARWRERETGRKMEAEAYRDRIERRRRMGQREIDGMGRRWRMR